MRARRMALWLVVASGLGGLTHGADAAITRNRLAQNRLATNRLASNRLATNRLATNRLATNALSSNVLEASEAAHELLTTAEGRELFAYVVSCALPQEVSIQALLSGAADSAPPNTAYTCASGVCRFDGGLGLAPDWAEHKLTSKAERWVSACLLARVNHHVTAEAISLRGDHPGLAVGVDEAELYNLEEGAFYGNVFTHQDDPIEWYACRGRAQAASEDGGLGLRDCAEPDPDNPGYTLCGFIYTGDCADYDQAPSAYACKSGDSAQGVYGECHAAPGPGKWQGARKYREVITAYVSP